MTCKTGLQQNWTNISVVLNPFRRQSLCLHQMYECGEQNNGQRSETRCRLHHILASFNVSRLNAVSRTNAGDQHRGRKLRQDLQHVRRHPSRKQPASGTSPGNTGPSEPQQSPDQQPDFLTILCQGAVTGVVSRGRLKTGTNSCRTGIFRKIFFPGWCA